jgi:hypothetical protein
VTVASVTVDAVPRSNDYRRMLGSSVQAAAPRRKAMPKRIRSRMCW